MEALETLGVVLNTSCPKKGRLHHPSPLVPLKEIQSVGGTPVLNPSRKTWASTEELVSKNAHKRVIFFVKKLFS